MSDAKTEEEKSEAMVRAENIGTPLGDMMTYESIAQKLLEAQIYNQKLLSLLTRFMRWEAETNAAKQTLIMEYQTLVGMKPESPEDPPESPESE